MPLYPPITAFAHGLLNVGAGHEIYWERVGKKGGIPVVFLHGGPGSGCTEKHRQYFNPKVFDVLLFDQRGCGRSRFKDRLKENTTAHLVADMEKLRTLCGFEKWILFGGSWGSTLSLAYADTHPKHVSGLVIRGIFLGRKQEANALYAAHGPAAQIFPDAYEKFIAPLPSAARKNPMVGFAKLFSATNAKVKLNALQRWQEWEMTVSSLIPDPAAIAAELKNVKKTEAFSSLEHHYISQTCFMDGDALLKRIGKKIPQKIPVHIVQGRYDLVCPFITAWQLHKAIAHSKLHIIPDAGHAAASNPLTQQTLLNIMNGLGKKG